MLLTERLQRLGAEPPPEFAFEVSEDALSQCSPRSPGPPRVELLGERALAPSPSAPNVLRAQLFRDALERVAGPLGQRRTAALVIPDYAVRMAVLDFQDFPAKEEDRTALLRFRLRKTVPFHIEEANVSYAIQTQEPKHTEVLAVAIARPILEDYERLFVEQGFRVGLVTPSILAAIPLFPEASNGLTLVMKVAGSAVSVVLIQGDRVRVIRSVDMSQADEHPDIQTRVRADDLIGLVQQTAAYAEDQIGEPIQRVLVCGFDQDNYTEMLRREFEVAVEPIQTRFGAASEHVTGLLGLLERYPS